MKKIDTNYLKEYLKANICPILIEDLPLDIFDKAIILNNNCDINELNGYYDGIDFLPPNWYKELLETSTTTMPLLIIKNLNQLPVNEQSKFNEILKYRKISTFKLPSECRIIVSCNDINKYPISEDVYSLLAHI